MWLRRKVHPAVIVSGAAAELVAEPSRAGRPTREPAPAYRAELGAGPRLVLAFDQELSARLRQAARGRSQPLGELAAELLDLGLQQQAQRARAEQVLEALTPRQRQVTWMSVQGQTNRQIAEALVISPETVKTHLRHALAQLGLHSKAELRMLLLDLGMRWWEEG
jgi:DNA-binding NarL/FixJ family response regulator